MYKEISTLSLNSQTIDTLTWSTPDKWLSRLQMVDHLKNGGSTKEH
jgi:hypothetical protein